MKLNITKTFAILTISLFGGIAQAEAAPRFVQHTVNPTPIGMLLPAVQAAREAARPGPMQGATVLIGGGVMEDTCTQSFNDNTCDIDDLTQRCDDAGGGMSSLPGGGVDCDTSGWDNE